MRNDFEDYLAPGDIVSRRGDGDLWEVLNFTTGFDVVHVRCVRESPVDPATMKSWCMVGDVDQFLSDRLDLEKRNPQPLKDTPMRYTLHFPHAGTVDHVDALAQLARGLHWKPTDTHVYLINDAAGSTYLFATDGQVIRYQRFYLHRSAALCQTWAESLPLDTAPPCHGWIEDNDNPETFVQLDLVSRPLKLASTVEHRKKGEVFQRSSAKDYRATFADADWSTADKGVLDQGFRHLRPFPETFPAFPTVLGPVSIATFAKTLSEASYTPPLALVPEPQIDTQDKSRGRTWAKYYTYHARTLEPLGVIMGSRVPEFVQKVKAKR